MSTYSLRIVCGPPDVSRHLITSIFSTIRLFLHRATRNAPNTVSATPHLPGFSRERIKVTRAQPSPNVNYSILPDQMKHGVRLQLMMSGGFHLHSDPERRAGTAITPCDNAGICPCASGTSTVPSLGTGGSSLGASKITGMTQDYTRQP